MRVSPSVGSSVRPLYVFLVATFAAPVKTFRLCLSCGEISSRNRERKQRQQQRKSNLWGIPIHYAGGFHHSNTRSRARDSHFHLAIYVKHDKVDKEYWRIYVVSTYNGLKKTISNKNPLSKTSIKLGSMGPPTLFEINSADDLNLKEKKKLSPGDDDMCAQALFWSDSTICKCDFRSR